MLKKAFVILLFMVFLGGAFTGLQTKGIQTEVFIRESRQRVWSVLVDINNWSQWNPNFKATKNMAQGKALMRSRLVFTTNNDDDTDSATYESTVVKRVQPAVIQWREWKIHSLIFKHDEIFELQKQNNGTKLIYKEEFSGILIPFFWNELQKTSILTQKKMTQSLKNHIESLQNPTR